MLQNGASGINLAQISNRSLLMGIDTLCNGNKGTSNKKFLYVVLNIYSKEIKDLTGKTWREVISISLLFMWAKVIDLMMEGEESKWFKQGEIFEILLAKHGIELLAIDWIMMPKKGLDCFITFKSSQVAVRHSSSETMLLIIS